ncbi:MAG TPA: exodeoxyribonuclease VII small subunit [Gemmatimonadaceae bacterium]|nr:exodeoxyribonuclease VII small subunit [Gemmatimonadaceae bacterium]
MTFEERLARLEDIASTLEHDEIDLARALELFEEGIANLRAAADELARAEARVQRLVERADGSFDVVDAGE